MARRSTDSVSYLKVSPMFDHISVSRGRQLVNLTIVASVTLLLGFATGIVPGLLSGLVGWHLGVAFIPPIIWAIWYVYQRAKRYREVTVITYTIAVLAAVGFGGSVWIFGSTTSSGGDELTQVQIARDGDTVAVHYTGTLGNGEVFDSSLEGEPLSFVLGSGRMIKGFDAVVHGMKVGDTVTVLLEPAEAYGERDDDLIVQFPIDQLPEGFTEGSSIRFQDGRQGLIVELTDEMFRVDVNHRLAGKALTFEIELISIE